VPSENTRVAFRGCQRASAVRVPLGVSRQGRCEVIVAAVQDPVAADRRSSSGSQGNCCSRPQGQRALESMRWFASAPAIGAFRPGIWTQAAQSTRSPRGSRQRFEPVVSLSGGPRQRPASLRAMTTSIGNDRPLRRAPHELRKTRAPQGAPRRPGNQCAGTCLIHLRCPAPTGGPPLGDLLDRSRF